MLQYLFAHVTENHDIQVRYHWNVNDLAIWDNRSTLHAVRSSILDIWHSQCFLTLRCW